MIHPRPADRIAAAVEKWPENAQERFVYLAGMAMSEGKRRDEADEIAFEQVRADRRAENVRRIRERRES